MNFKFNFKEFLNKITNKKYINKLLTILILGIMLLITASIFKDNKKEEVTKKDNIEKEIKETDVEDYAYILERKLEKILSQIKGAGNVDVMITLDETTEKIPAVNKTKNQEKTNEEDSQGGVREINREDSTLQVVTKGNGDSILVLKEVKPKIKGVIIVAEGAYDIEVKEQLYKAVKTVLDVSGNKVEVYSSN